MNCKYLWWDCLNLIILFWNHNVLFGCIIMALSLLALSQGTVIRWVEMKWQNLGKRSCACMVKFAGAEIPLGVMCWCSKLCKHTHDGQACLILLPKIREGRRTSIMHRWISNSQHRVPTSGWMPKKWALQWKNNIMIVSTFFYNTRLVILCLIMIQHYFELKLPALLVVALSG